MAINNRIVLKKACVCVSGEGEAVGPGEEIPQPDGGEELPQILHCNERGEGATGPVCSEHTLLCALTTHN